MRRHIRSCFGAALAWIALGVLAGCGGASANLDAHRAPDETWMRVPAKITARTPYVTVLGDQAGGTVELLYVDVKEGLGGVFVRQGAHLPRVGPKRGRGDVEVTSSGPQAAAGAPSHDAGPGGASGAFGCALFIKFACNNNEVVGVCAHSAPCPQP